MSSSLGTRLREVRERKGVSLTAIAEDTKINVALFEGLERDDISRWPGGIFRRAYVRAYAQAIGLEPEAIVREFVEMHPDPIEEALADAAAGGKTNTDRTAGRFGILRGGFAKVPAEPTVTLRASTSPFERDINGLANLCVALSRAEDQNSLSGILQDAARLLGARGLVLWVWDAVHGCLSPAIAHGYSEQLLQQLARVARSTDNSIAAAFRTAQARVVDGGGRRATGAFVTPLLTPVGCAGVLAIEFGNGAEQRESIQAFATILGAQLATLLPTSLVDAAVNAGVNAGNHVESFDVAPATAI